MATHEEGDHGKAAVLDLSFPQLLRALAAVRKVQGVERTARVDSLLGVQLAVPVDLSTTCSRHTSPPGAAAEPEPPTLECDFTLHTYRCSLLRSSSPTRSASIQTSCVMEKGRGKPRYCAPSVQTLQVSRPEAAKGHVPPCQLKTEGEL